MSLKIKIGALWHSFILELTTLRLLQNNTHRLVSGWRGAAPALWYMQNALENDFSIQLMCRNNWLVERDLLTNTIIEHSVDLPPKGQCSPELAKEAFEAEVGIGLASTSPKSFYYIIANHFGRGRLPDVVRDGNRFYVGYPDGSGMLFIFNRFSV